MRKLVFIILLFAAIIIPYQNLQSTSSNNLDKKELSESIMCSGVTVQAVPGGIEVTISADNVAYVKAQKYGPWMEYWVCDDYGNSSPVEICDNGDVISKSLPPATYDIEIVYKGPNAPGNCYINGITVTGGSTCGAPSNIQSSNRQSTSVDLSWSNENANSYTISSPFGTINSITNAASLTGINSSSFQVTITSNCPNNTTPSSSYTVPAFNSGCSALPFPDGGKDGIINTQAIKDEYKDKASMYSYGSMIGVNGAKEWEHFNPNGCIQQSVPGAITTNPFSEFTTKLRFFHDMGDDFFVAGSKTLPKDQTPPGKPTDLFSTKFRLKDIKDQGFDIQITLESIFPCDDEYLPIAQELPCCDPFCSNNSGGGAGCNTNILDPCQQSLACKTGCQDFCRRGDNLDNNGNGLIDETCYRSFPDKWYHESEWSDPDNNPSTIFYNDLKQSMKNYVKEFAIAMSPPCCTGNDCIVEAIEIGNEPWGYPEPFVYQALVDGAIEALEEVYDNDPNCTERKIKLLPGAFQNFRDNKITSFCTTSNQRNREDFGCIFDDMGEFLNCNIIENVEAINIHPYSFPKSENQENPNFLNLPPEADNSVFQSIVNTVAWRDLNAPNLPIQVTEYGYDTDYNPTSVNQAAQAAYLIRSLLIQGRYGIERSYVYGGFDLSLPNTQLAYQVSGLHTIGQIAQNSPCNFGGGTPPSYPPLGQKKAGFHAHKDFVDQLGPTKYQNAAIENNDIHAYIVDDGTDKFLVFWNPGSIAYNNGNGDIETKTPLTIPTTTVNLPAGFKLESSNAQIINFTDPNNSSNNPTPFSVAQSNQGCATATITKNTKMPAFIKLIPCGSGCQNVLSAGSVNTPSPSIGNSPFDPSNISNAQFASGGSGGSIVYQWEQSTDGGSTYSVISGATNSSYNPPSLTQTTLFKRGAKRSTCPNFIYTNPPISITVNGSGCTPYTSSCNTTYNGISVEVCGGDIQINVLDNRVKFVKIQSYFNNGYQEYLPCSDWDGSKPNCDVNLFIYDVPTTGNYDIEYNMELSPGNYITCSIPGLSVTSNLIAPNADQVYVENKRQEKIQKEENEFSIFPNPASNQIFINLKEFVGKNGSLKIINGIGEIIQELDLKQTSDNLIKFDLTKYSNGIYFISLNIDGHKRIVKRFVINKS